MTQDTKAKLSLDFGVIEGGAVASSIWRSTERAKLFELLPVIDEQINRMVNQVIAEMVALCNATELDGDAAVAGWYKIHAALRLRKSLMIQATVDTGPITPRS